MDNKANILVLGTSGAGKSTLINTVIGRKEARAGSGSHITEKMQSYESDQLNFRLIDSRGFEYSVRNTKRSVKDMKTWMKEGLKDDKPRIHMLWFCIDATSKRITKQTIKMMEQAKKEWEDIPVIVVLTKSFFIAEDEENKRMVETSFEKFAKKTGSPLAIIPVLAEAPKGENISSRGIEELVEITTANIDEAVRASDVIVMKYELKCKRIKAHAATLTAATSASVIGGIPISFPDAVVLTPLETLLITGISKIYNLDKNEDTMKKIITRIIEAGTVSMIAKAAVNTLKMMPGIVNLAADVLNAVVAGAIVLGIGEATAIIMEKVYLGDIDADDLEWIDKVVESCMGEMINKISNAVKTQDGKVNAKEILKTAFGDSDAGSDG